MNQMGYDQMSGQMGCGQMCNQMGYDQGQMGYGQMGSHMGYGEAMGAVLLGVHNLCLFDQTAKLSCTGQPVAARAGLARATGLARAGGLHSATSRMFCV